MVRGAARVGVSYSPFTNTSTQRMFVVAILGFGNLSILFEHRALLMNGAS